MSGPNEDGTVIETSIPARLDRLPWSGWHWMVVIALGITWLLDGLEVTLAGSLSGILKNPKTLGFTDSQIGLTATCYLTGAVAGALFFGYLTDRLGRKKLFTVTLLLYLTATALTAFSWNFTSFTVLRVLTGAGIGGEYAAINSAIDELIPARVRGRVDLLINSTFWIGAALGSGASILLLQPGRFPLDLGWRFAFGIGAALGSIIIFMRRHVPESPRWLMIHGDKGEAEKIAGEIEAAVTHGHPETLPKPEGTLCIHVQKRTPWREIWNSMAHEHRSRSVLAFSLMVTQAFFYNAVFFTYGLVLLRYYHVPAESLGLYLVPLALGNFMGPLLIGPLFDTVGRRIMISATYIASGVLLAAASWLFAHGALTLTQQALSWTVIFFIASSAASSAYLTVSEIFPLEIRALAISLFYAAGTLAGGVGGPALFGYLIGTGSRTLLFRGYLAGAALMVGGGLVEAWLGVAAEGKSLESIAAPLSSRNRAQVQN